MMENNISKLIEQFVVNCSENHLHFIDESPIFDSPVVGFADGHDQIFINNKSIIGSFHLTPEEVFLNTYRGKSPENISAICWVLPFTQAIKKSNSTEKVYPSKLWAHAKKLGEEVTLELYKNLTLYLSDLGYRAVAPSQTELYRQENITPKGIASTWSERHACFAAGLGTFSLSDGLISSAGIAVRCGSILTDMKLKPTERKYSTYFDNCLYLTKGICGKCIERCPTGAISKSGHDKNKCQDYINMIDREKREWYFQGTENLRAYKVKQPGCGLCQSGVPCESRIPANK